MADKKNSTPLPPNGDIRITADAGDFAGPTHFSATEDEWTEAEANAFIDELVSRNKDALRGLAKL